MIQPLLVFSDWGIFVLRVVLGIIMVAHGLPKIKDLKGTAKGFVDMGFKPGMFWGTIVAILEFVGGIGLIVGFLTQLIAFFIAIEFIVIILKLKRSRKFTGGYDFDILIVAAALLIATIGSGALSLEEFLRLVLY